jgi:hypothetical protein
MTREYMWSDRRFREFLTQMRGGMFAPPIDDEEREEFLQQAEMRLVPEVQRRLLAEVGATVDAYGVAVIAFEVIEDSAWDSRRPWLMASVDPWAFLSELVTRELATAYRETARPAGEDDDLAGILAASSRRALGAGDPGS